MSLHTGKPTIWFPARSDTNRYVQLEKQVRGLKFEDVCVCVGGGHTKGAFVFAYAECWFSDAAAQIE